MKLAPIYPSKQLRDIRMKTLRHQRDSMELMYDVGDIILKNNLQSWEKQLIIINYEII